MAAEAKGYVPEKPVVCIRRSDGMLVMANSMAQQHSMGEIMPYHGPMDANEQQRRMWVNGFQSNQGGTVKESIESGKFDIETASRTDLVEYAMDEFGKDLSKLKTRGDVFAAVKALRDEAANPAPKASGIAAEV